jgi:hypothetical protein
VWAKRTAAHLIDASLQQAAPQAVALHVWVDQQVMDGGHLQAQQQAQECGLMEPC